SSRSRRRTSSTRPSTCARPRASAVSRGSPTKTSSSRSRPSHARPGSTSIPKPAKPSTAELPRRDQPQGPGVLPDAPMQVSGVVKPAQSASVKHCERQANAWLTHWPHSGALVGTHGGGCPLVSTKNVVGPSRVLLMQLLHSSVPPSVAWLLAEHA